MPQKFPSGDLGVNTECLINIISTDYEIVYIISIFVSHYGTSQYEHHKKRTFQEELLAFLKKYNVEYDERYLWD